MKVYATYNIKGGVGKTTAAVNLAYLSAADGYRTLLWDLDPQGAASLRSPPSPASLGRGPQAETGPPELDERSGYALVAHRGGRARMGRS